MLLKMTKNVFRRNNRRRSGSRICGKSTSHPFDVRANAPQRVELSLQGKEADEKTRREGDTLSMERKFLELMKRKLRKKRAIAEAARQVWEPILPCSHAQSLCGVFFEIFRGSLMQAGGLIVHQCVQENCLPNLSTIESKWVKDASPKRPCSYGTLSTPPGAWLKLLVCVATDSTIFPPAKQSHRCWVITC